jgi:hypothetical protein
MNKLNQTLVTINGIIIPLFIGFALYNILDKPDNEYGGHESIIVGDELEKAKSDSLALQGITYESPEEIYNSTNFYLPVSVMTYEEAKELRKLALSAGDINPSQFNLFNVVFLDKDYKVIGQLLDKKGSITAIQINRGRYNYRDDSIDKTVKNIAYQIGFNDSNGDGKLNSLDDHDLYITDLNGQNLTQVTTKKYIVDFRFINSNSELFIRFKDRSNIRDEYKKVKFGVYNIASGTFNELKDLENKLTDIESQLIK